MILFFMAALMGSGFTGTQGDSQAAIATGHARRQKHLERHRKNSRLHPNRRSACPA